MTSLMTTALAGAAAGLGVAMPMGAMSVLLFQEGLRGWRSAAAGGLAVATVDLTYAAAATGLGPVVARGLSGVEAWVRLGAAVALVVIAARGLLSLRRGPSAAAAADLAGTRRSAPRTFVRFASLTLVNPTTALYFAALTTAQGDSLGSGAAGAVFVAAVFVASLSWQQLLAAAAALAGARLPIRARLVTHSLGYGLVAVYATLLAWPLPRP